ncbi:hypothetical protein [Pseudonocardia sp. HH130630-07]|uniref:hypothetical protein n=1 Tax=Pseudonocardia sp. HH130630-07 TaxID=1690815 RepID=UPI000814FE64|nr:hypothetical protein [Pseudonocardia sp. HH130630-07]ANY06987.1 hypothetical protein AFB00_12550 [Pseudonocardia sp. HH130630-07]
MNTHERRRLAALRADRETVLAAAAGLRHEAVQAYYAGHLPRPEYAFGLASVLELLGTRVADLDPDIRAHVVRVSREMTGDGMDQPSVRRTRRR